VMHARSPVKYWLIILAARLRQPHLIEQDGFQSAGKSIYWRLRRLKIFSFTHSANQTGVFMHGSDRTHVLINVR
ncbi:MAG: hypothetical protein WA753_17860, partial [Pseudolabrys sp.]